MQLYRLLEVLQKAKAHAYSGVQCPSACSLLIHFVSMMISYTMHSSTDWLRPHERSKHLVFHSNLRTTPQKPPNTDPLRAVSSVVANCVQSLGCLIASLSDWGSSPTTGMVYFDCVEELCLGNGTSGGLERRGCMVGRSFGAHDRPPARQRALLVSESKTSTWV